MFFKRLFAEQKLSRGGVMKKTTFLGRVWAIALTLGLAWPAASDVIQIRIAPGGTVMLTGTIVAVDDQFLTVNTKSGVTRVPRSAHCDGADCPSDGRAIEVVSNPSEASIVGTETIGNEVLLALIQGYAASEGVTVKLELAAEERKLISTLQSPSGGAQSVKLGLDNSASAISQLLNGEATLALTTRQITNEEAQSFIGAGLGDPRTAGRETVVALDALVIATSAANPIKSMTLEDAVGVVSGRVTNWSELGGTDSQIELLLPSETSEAYQGFSDVVMRPLRLRPSSTPAATLEKAELAQLLSNSPAAIGLTTLSGIGGARAIPLRLGCGLMAQPDQFSVKAEDYPLTRRVYLYSRDPNPAGITGALYNYAASPEGRQQFAALGYIDQSSTALPAEEQGMRFLSAIMAQASGGDLEMLQKMASEILSAQRLSTTFRFDATGEALDSRGELDIERLAALLRDNPANSEVVLLGFTDDVGRGEINQLVAKERADLVRSQLAELIGDRIPLDKIKSVGLGSTAPVACNTDVSGRQANRRVEVWIRG